MHLLNGYTGTTTIQKKFAKFADMTNTKKALNIAALIGLMLSLSACVNTQSSPSMVDYSYVPPSNVLAASPNPGIDDF